MMNLQELIYNLPIELFLVIRRLTYKPQSKILLNDIKNYYYTKEKISTIYYNKYKGDFANEKNADKNWLSNDIILFLNNYNALMDHINPKFYTLFNRFIKLKNNSIDDISKILIKILLFNKINVINEINIFWGIMTPLERNEFVSKHLKPHY